MPEALELVQDDKIGFQGADPGPCEDAAQPPDQVIRALPQRARQAMPAADVVEQQGELVQQTTVCGVPEKLAADDLVDRAVQVGVEPNDDVVEAVRVPDGGLQGAHGGPLPPPIPPAGLS